MLSHLSLLVVLTARRSFLARGGRIWGAACSSLGSVALVPMSKSSMKMKSRATTRPPATRLSSVDFDMGWAPQQGDRIRAIAQYWMPHLWQRRFVEFATAAPTRPQIGQPVGAVGADTGADGATAGAGAAAGLGAAGLGC